MSLSSSLYLLRLGKNIIVPSQYVVQIKGYAKADAGGMFGKGKKKLKLSQPLERKVLPVETDPEKLVKFVCGSNIMKEGQDIEIKPDSEYPDWLWDIHIGPPLKLEELDPDTKKYWRRVKKAAMRRTNLMAKLKPF
ncbi:39S ribosomal protein L54, mitochondrial [Neodiprion fabricii]|uniref:39S ribosomal protein L54, mitochondrial n=1 Tax=Neodiprion fabricii TaxID=2872261 RepID=UPI001ED95E06|nr:39S ribosomal protein L54, mitochondrial [Neodiprion fabricii]